MRLRMHRHVTTSPRQVRTGVARMLKRQQVSRIVGRAQLVRTVQVHVYVLVVVYTGRSQNHWGRGGEALLVVVVVVVRVAGICAPVVQQIGVVVVAGGGVYEGVEIGAGRWRRWFREEGGGCERGVDEFMRLRIWQH